MNFIVTQAAQRPARMDGTCFYCDQKIGDAHTQDCVLIKKQVKIRMIVEYDVTEPASWTAAEIEDMRNGGPWCANNAIPELQRAFAHNCMCGAARFEHVADIGAAYLDEQ